MIDLQAYLENKLRDIISTWNENDIYAISFFVFNASAIITAKNRVRGLFQ